MDCTALELDAIKFAKSAVLHDQKGKYNEAVFYYKVRLFKVNLRLIDLKLTEKALFFDGIIRLFHVMAIKAAI